MKPLAIGEEFFRVTPDEFAEINRAANAQGMIARVFEIDGEPGDPNMKISFELVQKSRKAS